MKTADTKVFFRYEKEQVQGEDGKVRQITKPDGAITAVAISVQTGEEIANRVVTLKHGDKPNKELGRKYAFKKLTTFLLDNKLVPGKEVEGLWREFGATCKQPSVKLAFSNIGSFIIFYLISF